MPKNENNIQFSLNTEQREKLKAIALGDESIGLTAKRIVLAALGEETKPTQSLDLSELVERITSIENCLDKSFYPIEENLSERFTALEEKVTSIEVAIDCEHFPPETVSDRFTQIESAISELRIQINQATSPVKRPSSPPPPRSRKK
jgi:hypothetical protein